MASSPGLRAVYFDQREKSPDILAMAKGISNWTYDLSLPGIHQFLPHTVNFHDSLVPGFKMTSSSGNPRDRVSMILGVPTVKRDHQSYLQVTLKSLLDNMSEEEAADTLVIVCVAEPFDLEFVRSVAEEIGRVFPSQVENGLIEVVSPPAHFYPDLNNLRQTLGDDPERVLWRSKQNLDYAFLMMYAQGRGTFYVQIEDDVLTKPDFVSIMKDFALDRTARGEPWFVIDFCQLGFIGKMFKSTELPTLIQFFLMFYNDKPGDWLLENVIQTKVCKIDQDAKKCKKERNQLRVQYKPSLFQHIGTHSSLKGKVQKLKDKQFGKVKMYVPHRNPPAKVDSDIRHYKSYSLTRAYNGDTFYWGLVPSAGDNLIFSLTPPTRLSGYKFVSGNAEHPSDKFVDTTVEVLFNGGCLDRFERTRDGFCVVGQFDPASGVAETSLDQDLGEVEKLRLTVHASSQNWVILSEIHLREAG